MNPDLICYKSIVFGLILQSGAESVLEIGLGALGSTALFILQNHPTIKFTSVDIERHPVVEILANNRNFNFILGSSDSFSLENMSYDLICVDGSHFYEAVKADIENIINRKLLNKGGYIILHDTNSGQIKNAIKDCQDIFAFEFLNMENLNVGIIKLR